MWNLLLLLILSPYTAILVGVYATYKVYKERQHYIIENKILLNSWNIGLLLLFAWSFIVGVINKSFLSTIASAAFILYFSLSLVMEDYFDSEDKLIKVAKTLIKLSVFAGIFGIVEEFVFANFDVPLWRWFLGIPVEGEIEHRVCSTFVNSNVAGDWFAIMILVSFYFQCKAKDKKELVKYAMVNLLFILNLCLTGSRGAIAGLIMGLVVLFILEGRKKNIIALVSIVAIVAIVGFMPNEVSAISEDITGHAIARSFDTRDDIWRGALKMTNDKPVVGWGLLGTIEQGKNYFTTDRVVNHAHNIWLALTTSLGVIGLSIYLAMRYKVYKGLYLLYKEKSKILPMLAGIQAILIIHGLIDFTIITPQIGIIFMGTSAITLGLAKEDVRELSKSRVQSNYNTL